MNYLGKEACGKLRNRWEDNIKMYIRDIGCEDWRWIYLV
jgi:hypothetical protein